MKSFSPRRMRAPRFWTSSFTSHSVGASQNHVAHRERFKNRTYVLPIKLAFFLPIFALMTLTACDERQTADTVSSDVELSEIAFETLCLKPALTFDEIGEMGIKLGFTVESIDSDPEFGFVSLFHHDANISLTKSAMADRYTCSARFQAVDTESLSGFSDAFREFAQEAGASPQSGSDIETFTANSVTYRFSTFLDTRQTADVSFSYTR